MKYSQSSGTKKTKPSVRQAWLLKYIAENGGIDILNLTAQDAYYEATGAEPYTHMMRDLRNLYNEGKLRRDRMPSGMPYSGCCKHVMHYSMRARK